MGNNLERKKDIAKVNCMIVNSPRVGPVAQVVCHELHLPEAFLLRAFFAKQNIVYKLELL